ncbi:MAG: phosphoribosylformylglycinamidine synthase subunit PurS [Coriobacteriia bacterium]|jgi:phosphoribosylformylglycinamidine synthase|nr:phosphoribosylformylglycinamidine synthase subunit PurS [Coriobacteriia bacterium]
MARYEVYVTYKEGVFDPPGAMAERVLANLGFGGVNSVSVGKFIEIDADADIESVRKMCDQLLANPVIEDYRIIVAGEA